MTSEDPGKVFIQRYTVFLHLQAERCFQYMTQKFGRLFHEKRGSALSRGFGIQKQVQL